MGEMLPEQPLLHRLQEAVERHPIFIEVHPQLCTVLTQPGWHEGKQRITASSGN